jgi:hypothetical protein
MTAQFSDSIAYRGKDYLVAGKNGKRLFDPAEHGLHPVGKCSACWRGFLCSYSVESERLLLDRLSIYLDQPAPILFDTEPKKDRRRLPKFDAVYDGLHHPMSYSGGLLLARDFIKDLYVHMGFHPAWKYRTVHELIFRDGKLREAFDRSEEIAEFRNEITNRPMRPKAGADYGEIVQWIRQCFSQHYKW